MSEKKKNEAQRRALASSNKGDWYAHIQSLGLASPEEYKAWCHKHGLRFHRKKTWRQERDERRIAERERGETAILKHIELLGLASVEAYLAWCGENGFRETTDKKPKQRQREIQFIRDQERAAKPARESTVGAQHLQALGLDSLEAYQAWCRQRGLSPSLDKGVEAQKSEVALATLAASKKQMGRSRSLIERIHAGTVDEEELKTVVLRQIHAGFAPLEGAARDAVLRLLLQVEAHAELLSPAVGALRWGRRPGNSFIEGLFALARHHEAWIRPIERWQPDSRVQHAQFGDLARYLLAKFDVPVYMDSVWFIEEGKEARQQQGWFVHIGTGANIRTADVPVELSKKMAHHFLQAPEHYTVEEAMRYGQIMAQGGNEALVEALVATHLGRSFDYEEFWCKVVTYFVKQPELELKWVPPIIGYIHHQKYEPLSGGDPAEPNFSMKSRSLPKLLIQVKKWQERWTREARLDSIKSADNETRRKYAYYYDEVKDDRGNVQLWTIEELTTSKALASEGDAMKHCVGSYASKLDKTAIWSLKVQEGDEAYHVLTIAIDVEWEVVTQVRGRFNLDPEPGTVNRSQSRSKLNKRENRYLGAAYDHLQSWLARENIGYSQFEDQFRGEQ